MIVPDQHFDARIFEKDVAMAAIRSGFGDGLVLAGERDPNVVGLCADLTDSTHMLPFKEKYPDRFIEVGVAEQNLAGVGSGMAAMGKVPFITSYAMFSPGRNWEQIRTTICYNDQPVKIAGSHAGISVGPDGGTHQAIEDIAITRVIPRMIVLSPCDAIEARKATIAAASTGTPVYLRLAREKTPVMTTDDSPFEIGKAQCVWDTSLGQPALEPQVTLIATGALLHQALVAAREVAADGIGSIVINLSTIKPIDEAGILAAVRRAPRVVTVEEHQVAGGMGSAVAELLVQRMPVPQRFIGVGDDFGQSGTPEELIAHYGMDTPHIVAAIRDVVHV
ncbi:MAG TPA: transketolase C-terminal domain-containing protein [Gemmatimonadales bacterium]|jgi:transketolase